MTTGTPGDDGALLRRHGLQVTAQRLAVLRAAAARPHSTADDIYAAVRAEIGAISRQGVYDGLAALTDKGILRRIEPAGSPARYEDRVGDNHHHLVCRACGRTVEVEGPAVEAWADRVAGHHGFSDVTHTIEIFGTCADCAGSAQA